MTNRMVALENTAKARVVIKKPEYGVNRIWQKRGQVQAIPYEVLEQLLYDNGVRHMIDSGILYIKDMKTKQDLGLEPLNATRPVNIIALTQEDMNRLWNDVNIDEFAREVSDLPKVQVDNLIEYAVDTRTVDANKAQFLKNLTGKDILATIARDQEVEEAEKRERESAAFGRR